jgi:hypothetical protein
MNLKINGSSLRKNTKNKFWWLKLGVTIVVTNILFFLLFSSPDSKVNEPRTPQGWVEFQVKAELLTPFQKGKKIIILNRKSQIFLTGMLEENSKEPDGRITVQVKDEDASKLIRYDMWEIIPDLKNFTLPKKIKGAVHEIRY